MLIEISVKLLSDDETIPRGRAMRFSLMQSGVFFTPAEMTDWIDNNQPPAAKLAQLGRVKRETWENLVEHCRYWISPTLNRGEAAERRRRETKEGDEVPWRRLTSYQRLKQIKVIDDIVESQMEWAAFAKTQGKHTVWGDAALQKCGIAVLDVPTTLIEDMTSLPVDRSVKPPYHRQKPLERRAYTVDFSSLTSETLTRWDNPDEVVAPASLGRNWNDAMAWKDDRIGIVELPEIDIRGRRKLVS